MARIKGLENLNAKLKRLRTETAAAVQPAMAQAADVVVATQKHLCPVGVPPDDKHPGALRDSIHWSFHAEGVGLQRHTNETRVLIMAGGEEAPYARIIEFGTPNHPAIPFFFTGYRAAKKRARAIINKGVKMAVQKAAR